MSRTWQDKSKNLTSSATENIQLSVFAVAIASAGEACGCDRATIGEKFLLTFFMSDKSIYISRKSAEELQAAFKQALQNPENSPTLFQVWGVGGVGKTTLKNKLIQDCGNLADFVEASFNFISMGLDVEISNPISLMNQLYQQLESNSWKKNPFKKNDSFLSLYKLYYETISELRSQPLPDRSNVTEDQKNQVKSLVKNSAKVANLFGVLGATVVEKNSDSIVEGATIILNEVDRWKDFLAQHRATKQKQELQELMLKPLPKLTEAFVKSLQERKNLIVLVLDTYEQAPPEIDTWLLYLLVKTNLIQSRIKILIAGRRNLLNKKSWQKLQQDKEAIYERSLLYFDREQIAEYLREIGINELSEVKTIAKATKGLPYYLNKIRDCIEQGKTLDFSAIDREIEALLLQGLNKREKLVVQLAACCRWFNQSLFNYLLSNFAEIQRTLKKEEIKRDWFDWLCQRGFVKYAKYRWSLDDVARDIFRESFCLEDRDRFEEINARLADYFQQQADREVSPDRHPVEKYKNSAWRGHIAEFIYYLLHCDRDSDRVQFFSYLLESCYFEQDDVFTTPISFILVEFDSERRFCIKESTRYFIDRIYPIVFVGKLILGENKIDYGVLKELGFSQDQIDEALQMCLQNTKRFNSFDNLSKYVALFYKSKYCPEGEKLNWLRMANEQAKRCYCTDDLEFTSGLFLWDIGNYFHYLGQYNEAVTSFNKAIEFKSDLHEAWSNRGFSLVNLGSLEEAISSFDKAIDIKPDKHEAWYNRGVALEKLGGLEEALNSYDKAIEFKLNLYEAWSNRGFVLEKLGRLEEAISSYDKAIEFKPNYYKAWSNRGVNLGRLGRLEEAIESYDKAIEFKPDYHKAWYNRGIDTVKLGRFDDAISSFNRAIEFKPNYYKALSSRGVTLSKLGKLEEAISNYEKAIDIKPDYHKAWYNKSCAYALQEHIELALENLQTAIELEPEKYREMAKTDTDFDRIRNDERFQRLLNPDEN